MTLVSLDNEIIFKKAFTDKMVFKAFVHDILGLEIEIEKIETEKKFDPKIGYIDFELDIFAETTDKRIIIEIQRIEYDHNFDRFLHYFLMAIAEQQKRSRDYGISQTVYVIVVLTAPYTISDKGGQPIKDEVLLLKLNPKTLNGQERELYEHQFVCLNPNYADQETPKPIRDWLTLIYESIHNAENAIINRENAGIRRAAELISFENLTPEERALSKNKEAGKITIAKIENAKLIEVAKNFLKIGLSVEVVAENTTLSLEQVRQIFRNL
jgi:PD-(D/E)XK nuclease family transposase